MMRGLSSFLVYFMKLFARNYCFFKRNDYLCTGKIERNHS